MRQFLKEIAIHSGTAALKGGSLLKDIAVRSGIAETAVKAGSFLKDIAVRSGIAETAVKTGSFLKDIAIRSGIAEPAIKAGSFLKEMMAAPGLLMDSVVAFFSGFNYFVFKHQTGLGLKKTLDVAQADEDASNAELVTKSAAAAGHLTLGLGTIPMTAEMLMRNPGRTVRFTSKAAAAAMIPAEIGISAYRILEADTIIEEAKKTGDKEKLAEGQGQYVESALMLGGSVGAMGYLAVVAVAKGPAVALALAVGPVGWGCLALAGVAMGVGAAVTWYNKPSAAEKKPSGPAGEAQNNTASTTPSLDGRQPNIIVSAAPSTRQPSGGISTVEKQASFGARYDALDGLPSLATPSPPLAPEPLTRVTQSAATSPIVENDRKRERTFNANELGLKM